MCGITGVFTYTESSESFVSSVEKATLTLRLRGPDTQNIKSFPHAVLGHARLSIIDVSDAASQPFTDTSGRYTIVFNGEFYNFKDYYNELQNDGVRFHSQSDTEVLLYLYIKYKENCLEKINGFFAFAVYDALENEIFLARDRFGIKPLLYSNDNQGFMFASEMKALLQMPIDKSLNQISLSSYLHLNYIPQPETIFKSVKMLKAGTWMRLNQHRIIKNEYYYKIASQSLDYQISDYESAKIRLQELLEASVVRRLIADVPLGAFLSGGIDSSVICGLASRHVHQLQTFSIGYADEPFFDETHYAEKVAAKFNTKHTVFKLTNNDLYNHLFDVLDYTDIPFADSSALAVNILCKHTKKHVTVALSGDGADEMFAGYNKHKAEYLLQNSGLKIQLALGLHPLLSVLPKGRNGLIYNKIRQLVRFAEGAKLSGKERYLRWCGYTRGDEVARLLLKPPSIDDFQTNLNTLTACISNERQSISNVLRNDMELVLQSDMLVKVDMMSMANSLEVRVPFLDYTLVDFVFNLPDEMKINAKMGKRILQDSYKDFLPEELYRRPKKGFEVPMLSFLRNGLRSLMTEELFRKDFIEEQGIFNYSAIADLLKKMDSGNPEDVHARLWGLLVFQYWWKKTM